MLKLNKDPSLRELKQFAALWFPAFWAVVGLLIYKKAGIPQLALVLWAMAVILSIAGFLRPSLMRPVFIGMSAAVFPIGWVVSHVLLAVVYFLVLTPIGLALRLLGRDPLQRRTHKRSHSYWIPRDGEPESDSYFRQF